MSDQDAFERILASLHEAMLDDALWPATLALIDEACGCQGSCLAARSGPQDNVRVVSIQFYCRGERRTDWEREYLEVYHPIDERVPRLRQLPDSKVVHTTELYTAEELKTSPTYNEMLPRFGAQNSLNVRLDGPAGSSIGWGLHDPVTQGGWESAQLTLIKGLLPHIRQFVRVQQAVVGAEALGASMLDLLDTTRLGVIHLDRRGRIVEANDRARAILRRGDGLSGRGGMLRARDPAAHARLVRLLAGALPTSGTPAVSGSMTLRRTSLSLPFVVHVKPVVGQHLDFRVHRVAALVLIVEPGRQPRIDPGLVAETLGLTVAESQVAIWLAEGKGVNELAKATGRTPAAIHYHLRQIYKKLRLTRQADVIRLVLSLAEVI